MRTAAAYQERAFSEVGLAGADVRRMRREHAEGRLDIDERRRLMRAIGAAYASLYLSAPDRFLWMAFAAVAVHDGVRPASDLAAAAARSPWLRLLGAPIAAVADQGARAAFETNFAIFADLYWVHLAYVDGGLALLRALDAGAEIRAGFALIDRGDRAGVVAGNRILFRHEQKHAVTPVFAKYHRAIAVATRLGLISVPNRKLRASCAALRRSPDWRATDTSYGSFRARWRWLLASSWEPFVRMHRHERAALHAEVWRAVALVPE